ncbi:MAG: hypothetical protein QF371_07195, partial [Flavobacteriales bacterium]|nr:hypothetical protein [Flavobacteriales bacterium]
RVIATASALTTAAPSFKKRINKLWSTGLSNIEVIYNGYFEEKFNRDDVPPLKSKFTITHAGTLYYFQKVETFLKGMLAFKQKHPELDFDLIFYGLNFYPAQIERIRLSAKNLSVKFVDKLPHEGMLKELARSHVQLLLATPEKAQIYAKVFDYMATGRPIMMVENDKGPLEEMLKNHGNVMLCTSAEDVTMHMENLISDPSRLNTVKNQDNTFTRRNQTKRMAEVILNVIKQQG